MEKRKTGLALELLTTVVAHSDISNTAMCTLATNLWGLVQRTGQADTKAMVCVMLECLLFVWRGSVCACVWVGGWDNTSVASTLALYISVQDKLMFIKDCVADG